MHWWGDSMQLVSSVFPCNWFTSLTSNLADAFITGLPWSDCLLNFPWTKWPPFCSRNFQTYFPERKSSLFDYNFTDVCSKWSNWQKSSTGLDNGLASNWQQAIIWTNADPIHWRICGTRGRWVNYEMQYVFGLLIFEWGNCRYLQIEYMLEGMLEDHALHIKD